MEFWGKASREAYREFPERALICSEKSSSLYHCIMKREAIRLSWLFFCEDGDFTVVILATYRFECFFFLTPSGVADQWIFLFTTLLTFRRFILNIGTPSIALRFNNYI